MSESNAITEFIEYIYDLDDFPNKHSLSDKLIGEFITIIANNEDFTIKLEDTAKWLNTKECALKQTLSKSYTINDDYIVIKSEIIKKGRPKDHVFLTIDCFKRLCLRSKTKQSEIIRSYFILIEDMYREYMTNKIYNRQQLESGDVRQFKKTKKLPVGHCVYVIKITQPNQQALYKIGRTNNINRRFKELSREIYGKLEIVIHEIFEEHIFLEICTQSFLKKFKKEELSEVYETDLDTIKLWLNDCKQYRKSREKMQSTIN